MKLRLWTGIVLGMLFMLLGCSGGARVSEADLYGTWVTDTNTGKEELILRSDRTYVQTFSSPDRQFTNRGTWKSGNQFLGGTEIDLRGANLSEDEATDSPLKHGILSLQVYREGGKLKLARNAAADWYYERSR